MNRTLEPIRWKLSRLTYQKEARPPEKQQAPTETEERIERMLEAIRKAESSPTTGRTEG